MRYVSTQSSTVVPSRIAVFPHRVTGSRRIPGWHLRRTLVGRRSHGAAGARKGGSGRQGISDKESVLTYLACRLIVPFRTPSRFGVRLDGLRGRKGNDLHNVYVRTVLSDGQASTIQVIPPLMVVRYKCAAGCRSGLAKPWRQGKSCPNIQ